jgi:hypothetical protein
MKINFYPNRQFEVGVGGAFFNDEPKKKVTDKKSRAIIKELLSRLEITTEFPLSNEVWTSNIALIKKTKKYLKCKK